MTPTLRSAFSPILSDCWMEEGRLVGLIGCDWCDGAVAFVQYLKTIRLAMLSGLANSTVRVSCEHYQRLLADSASLEQEVSSFGAALSKTLISLTLRDAASRPLALPEMRELREAVLAMIDRTKDALQRDCLAIVEGTAIIRRVAHELAQLNELMRREQERTTQAITELTAQLKVKQAEVEQWSAALQNEQNRQAEQAWRKAHYVNAEAARHELPGATYLHALRDVTAKLEEQLSAQRTHQRTLTLALMENLKDFKEKLLKAWNLLPLASSALPSLSPSLSASPPPSEERLRREISELQRRYLVREQEVDDFEVEDLAGIKKKLRLLEEAEMSESREYLGYSASAEPHIVESQVVPLLRS